MGYRALGPGAILAPVLNERREMPEVFEVYECAACGSTRFELLRSRASGAIKVKCGVCGLQVLDTSPLVAQASDLIKED